MVETWLSEFRPSCSSYVFFPSFRGVSRGKEAGSAEERFASMVKVPSEIAGRVDALHAYRADFWLGGLNEL
jgi:hypothetical protein